MGQEVGNRIRKLRNERKISGTKIAEKLGVSPQYFYDLEKGERRLNESLILKLSEIFDVSTDYLLGLTDSPSPIRDTKTSGELIRYYRHKAGYGTIEELSKDTNIPIDILKKYESNELKPNLEDFKKLRRHLGVDFQFESIFSGQFIEYAYKIHETGIEFIATTIRDHRINQNLTREQLAKAVGIKTSDILKLEQGLYFPSKEELEKIANTLDIPKNDLFSEADYLKKIKEIDILEALEDNETIIVAGSNPITSQQRVSMLRALINPESFTTKTPTVPILGTIKAGIPILSEENYDGELEIPSDMDGDFAVEVSGDSMIGAGINPGDFIICKQSQVAYNKDIVAAVRHGEVTLKYFIENNGHGKPILRAANPEYEDIPIDEHTRIEGIKIALIRKEPTPYHQYQEYIAIRNQKLQDWDEVFEMAVTNGMDPDFIKGILATQIEMARRFANKNFFSS